MAGVATFQALESRRMVKTFLTLEGELKVVATFNSLSMVAYSAGTGLIAFVLGLVAEAAITGWNIDDQGKAFFFVVGIICFALAGACFWAGRFMQRTRGSMIERIEKDAEHGKGES